MSADKKSLLIAASIAVALGAGFGLAKLTDHSPAPKAEAEEGEEKSEPAGDAVKLTPQQTSAAGVSVVTVSRGGAGDLRLTGRVEASPSGRAAVAAPVSGAVIRLLATPGSNVGAGAGLVVIRSADGAAVRAESVAAAAEAEAARTSLAREERLFKSGVTARQDWEAAQAVAARANAEAVAARAKVAAAGAPGASGETVVRSPIAGVVTLLQAAPGGFVSQGGPIAEVANTSQVEVVMNAPAEVAAKLRVGAPLLVIGPDGSESNATIIGIAPLAQGETGATMIRARPSSGRFLPGAAVSASIATGGGGYPTVPAEAVQTVGGKSVVFVAVPDGFHAQPVTVGRSGAGYTEIVEGLKGGERIAGRGAFVLKAELSKGDAKDED
ncbi:MAG: efflux RND transporter periplasmic adaptor subunit [Phenylobacterium sp.]|uniref:efflux RND transporter periplasmic adaptor subunit n=1 Tax=Phenylobacterium sp. TaxID=1871053 RepID=UPI001A47D285|nr:efflux RND transporter periplasmic adaptor subunit [Phenylobacterium sp.]MBL8552888.1 efflux RND transporter periplasmic adaptor subunit [Phenylobacterium sp.]